MPIVNPWLLILGSLFVAIPIVVHLVMRRKPKPLVFPALRFVKQRHEPNRRRLQLRRWLLLLLRCLAILTLAAALARPSASSELVGQWIIIGVVFIMLIFVLLLAVLAWAQRQRRLVAGLLTGMAAILGAVLGGLVVLALWKGSSVHLGQREAPVAAVLVIDTSPRMQYRHANQTRLERAQQIAQWLIRQLPPGSQVSVADGRGGDPFYSVDLAAAKKRIDVLQTTYVSEPLITTIEKSLRLVRDSDRGRKEIYVLSDLTEAAWAGDPAGALRRQLARASDVALYVIDVGVEVPQNFALGPLRLAAESIPNSGELHLTTELRRLGPAGTRTVQLRLEKPDLTKPTMLDGRLQLPQEAWVRSATCEVDADSSQAVEFYLGGLALGVHQGYVAILGQDGLPLDDKRYFTIEVKEAWRVLVVAPPGGTARFLTEALAPYAQRQTGEASYQCTVIQPGDLGQTPLNDFAAVAILDPPPLAPAAWEKLADHVAQGGGAAIFLGHNAKADRSFNGQAPQKLLAGQLAPLIGRSTGDLHLATPRRFDHPVTAEFRGIASSVPWREFPVYRYWVLSTKADAATDVLRFTNNRPALVDRPVGRGRALTMTTPISDPARPAGRGRWNDLPLGNAWPYFIMVNRIFSYLVQSSDTQLNYLVGQTAVLPNNENEFPDKYDLFLPSGPPQPVRSQHGRIVVRATKMPGAYRLRGSRGGPVVRGFSANLRPADTRLARTDTARLDEVLGARRYRLARSRQEIDRGQGEARVGREFYPLLVSMLAAVLAVELLMANRFYRSEA